MDRQLRSLWMWVGIALVAALAIGVAATVFVVRTFG
jgi:hypothetical protein